MDRPEEPQADIDSNFVLNDINRPSVIPAHFFVRRQYAHHVLIMRLYKLTVSACLISDLMKKRIYCMTVAPLAAGTSIATVLVASGFGPRGPWQSGIN